VRVWARYDARSSAESLREYLSRGAIVNSTNVDEVERLRAAELEAERQYGQAVREADLSAVRSAADVWRKAADALRQYVAKHPRSYRDNG
jgi:hypothetical protein